jgi:hypothetical protein
MARMLGAPGQKELQQMNNLIVPIISLCVVAGVVLADTPMPSQDMGQATIRRDINEVSQLHSDDSAAITTSGQSRRQKGCFEQLRFLP